MNIRLLLKIVIILVFYNVSAQTNIVNNASGDWSTLIKLDNFDPNDDQQSNADTDFVGNSMYAIIETQKETVSFSDGITDEVYYFRVRMGQSNPNTSFYFGLDINGDYIGDLFIEANVKSQIPYVAYHIRDYSLSGLSPSQTSWLNGIQNNELELTSRDAVIRDYEAGTDLDVGNSGTDYWIEFGITEESIKSYVLDNFNLSISGDTIIALYGFTSTSQTSNGDVLGVDDTIPGELDKTWVELGVVINGTLNNITDGNIVTPTVDFLTTTDTTPTITGTWGSNMLGDDSLTVTLNGIVYNLSNGLIINNLNWSLPIEEILSSGIYSVVATTTRSSNGEVVSDLTENELTIQDTPFNCDYNAYLFQYNDVYAIDLASGNSYEVATDITEGTINAAAYNPADGFIWGSLSTPSKTIVRIGKNFETSTHYVDELPTSNRYVGDISAEGMYYLKGGGTTYYKIDLDPDSPNYGQHVSTLNLSQSINHHDWAFNAVDNKLYTVEKNTNILYRIDAETGIMENLGEVPILSGLNYTYGAVYFDVSGRFYVSANQTGTIYVIQSVQDLNGTNSMDSNLFAFGPSSSQNDGARCPTAPVPQEICDNGIDDDGDGLIDCEDPSCSGYGDCDVIDPPTSGGNDGGLESNNRLSNQINQRNFNRAKTSYNYDSAKAQRIKKSTNYAQRNSNLTFNLQDFIPLNVISEEYAVESTPTDLLNITNAIEVYAVDYMNNTNTVASILALKTEDGVYEHTKYICDRLLGGELISVSTININEQSFIKSIIRNTDNTVEYVLSLSAKEVNNNENFAIESHWNLDKYESNVTFYNFQIWSNSLDDLLLLGEEVISLLNTQRPISSYNNSKPPTVFVRKGKYVNGKLDLQIINTNKTETIFFDAGIRVTETSNVINESSNINLNEEYITNLEYDIGNLFDIGFRIGDGVATPDDLFMSDGPWGIDDSANTTVVNSYDVLPNSSDFETTDFPIERNINLEATTSEYVAVYRALTPRFNPIDLTDYNSFKFKAKGTGNMQITFVKKSIDIWEEQYKTNIQLTDTYNQFIIPFSEFSSINDAELKLDDIVTIVFTMVSENGGLVTKSLSLQDISFTFSETLNIESFDTENLNLMVAIPNPMNTNTTIKFVSSTSERLQFVIYNQLGIVVYKTSYTSHPGKNEITLNRQKLSSGLYFCNMVGDSIIYNPLKLLIK